MAFTIVVDSTEPHLSVRACGQANYAELSGLAALLAQLVAASGQRRVLANLAQVQPDLGLEQDLRLGALTATVLDGVRQLAVVVPEGLLNAAPARAAQIAGLPLRTFLNVEDAEAWLAQKAAA